MTNGQLFKYHQELQKLKGSILEFLLRSKIREFYNKNGIRINTLVERINNLGKEYFEVRGEQLFYDSNKKPIPLKGKDPAEHKTKMDELMKIEVNIIL